MCPPTVDSISLSTLGIYCHPLSSKIYEDDGARGHAEHWVSKDEGALALVRPDGYIAMITELDNATRLMKWMNRFMVKDLR